jgi:F-box protein 18 (helicase)
VSNFLISICLPIVAELKYGECSIAFVGGMDSYPWNKMNQVYALKQNQRSSITDPFIRQFESFAKFKEFVQSSQDAEYGVVVKLVERYDAQCPQLIAQLQDRLVPSEKGHCAILTTAHKSKGLEFDNVKLGDDFIDLNENLEALSGQPLEDSLVEELNILYVAISRARRSLEIPSKLKRFLASRGCLIDQPRLFCERL